MHNTHNCNSNYNYCRDFQFLLYTLKLEGDYLFIFHLMTSRRSAVIVKACIRKQLLKQKA